MKNLNEITDPEKRERSNHLYNSIGTHFHDNYKDIKPEEKEAVEHYQDDSSDINNYHWDDHKGIKNRKGFTTDKSEKIINQTNNLDNVIKKTKTPHKMVVYSGTIHDPREIKDENNIVHHPAFLSTSLSEPFAKRRAEGLAMRKSYGSSNHMLKIHVPKDSHAAFVPVISEDNKCANLAEKEVLLPRGTNLKHMKTTTEKIGELESHTHHMKVVN